MITTLFLIAMFILGWWHFHAAMSGGRGGHVFWCGMCVGVIVTTMFFRVLFY